jgi:hypothetical protein
MIRGLSIVIVLAGAAASPVVARPTQILPLNTIDCADWVHNPNGSWFAHTYAKPFDLGTAKAVSAAGTMVYADSLHVGVPPIDVWTILNAKCGYSRSNVGHSPSDTGK